MIRRFIFLFFAVGALSAHAQSAMCDALGRAVADSMKDVAQRKAAGTGVAEGAIERLIQMQAINANLALMGQHKCTPVDFVIYEGAYTPNARACEKDAATCPMAKWENTNRLGVRYGPVK